MYHLRGISLSSNTTKTLYVAEELGLEYEYTNMNLEQGEHKTAEHLERHPLGKLPTLSFDGQHLFESGAICRFLADQEGQQLYPRTDPYQRALVDQWMNFFTCHVGRHINTYAFESVAREKFGMGEPNVESMKEAEDFIETQLPIVDQRLGESKYLAGDTLSIADLYDFAYMENADVARLSLAAFPAIQAWYDGIKNRESVERAHARLGMRLSDLAQ